MGKYDELFEDWEIKNARLCVLEYKARFKTLNREDLDDLLQECLIHWLDKKRKYDPAKQAAIKTFMNEVINNKLMDILRSQMSLKKKLSYMTIPIDEILDDDDQMSSGLFAEDDQQLRKFMNSDLDRLLASAFEKLSRKQRKMCRLITDDGLSFREIGRVLNMSKGAVYDEIMRIRQVFREEGLNDYLEK